MVKMPCRSNMSDLININKGKKMQEIEKDMIPRLIEDLGIRRKEGKVGAYGYGLFECQYCGEEFEALLSNVKRGRTKSCGCLLGKNMTHGMGQNKFYQTWYNMIQRCTNQKHKYYLYYGARGITVCEEWVDVANFVAWAEATYPNTEGMSLDRVDNDKGYSPDNCRWTTREIQSTNQRVRSTNTSGFAGVSFRPLKNRWVANIGVNGKKIRIGSFKTKEEAVQARYNYIIENKLPHKLPHKLSTDYVKEIK